MAIGIVPVGHQGFNDRFKQVPFFIRSMSENVAYNQGFRNPVEVAVKGWIKSPGHRKNMESSSNICAVAICAKGRKFYFT
jgi:uncharacterized protein YkwD